MNVLSLFDGISCGQLALKNLGVVPKHYFASEIDHKAISVTSLHFPKTIHLGDVTKINYSDLPKIDLLIGGSPCQGFSYARHGVNQENKKVNFDDPRSRLFFEFLKAKNILNPKYVFLENVIMLPQHRNTITKLLNLYPIKICSSNFSAQIRKRYYWTNISFTYNSIISKTSNCKPWPIDIKETPAFPKMLNNSCKKLIERDNLKSLEHAVKAKCLLTSFGLRFSRNFFECGNGFRYISPVEMERLQGLPDDYTLISESYSARSHIIGNGWNVPTIQHIFKSLQYF